MGNIQFITEIIWENFKELYRQEVQTDKSKGKIYLPNWPSSYKNFLVSRKDLQPHIDFM